MKIRTYKPGDELAQAEIYNRAAEGLPGFKPTSVEEIERRYRAIDPDPGAKFYALNDDGDVVGYALLNLNGRISVPWCLPGAESVREPLLEAVLDELRRRGISEAWAAYRADWEPSLEFLREQGFETTRQIINYIAEVGNLPDQEVPEGCSIIRLSQVDLPSSIGTGANPITPEEAAEFRRFYLENPFIEPSNLFALIETREGRTLGAGLAIINRAFADPNRIDPAMPCYRLGAFGTERQRHKRVNGLVSCSFANDDEANGEILLAEASRRLQAAGLSHAAAQGSSDNPHLIAFYDRYFEKQGGFPILSRRLGDP